MKIFSVLTDIINSLGANCSATFSNIQRFKFGPFGEIFFLLTKAMSDACEANLVYALIQGSGVFSQTPV